MRRLGERRIDRIARSMRDPRVIAAMPIALVLAFGGIWLASGLAPGATLGISPASNSPASLASTSPLPDVASPSVPASAGALPEGAGEVAITSAPVPSAAPRPTPTPDPAIWRFEGRVVDADGKPIKDVCVAIGPRGCRSFSPHTDDRGVYYFDVPQVQTVVYDLYFVKDGYTIVWYRAQPTAPTVFNVVLHRPIR